MSQFQQHKHAGDTSPTTDRHNDKRIKFNEPIQPAHPFESVDYWLDFEPDQSAYEDIKPDTSFDNCFNQWLESSKANDGVSEPASATTTTTTAMTSVSPSVLNQKPSVADSNDLFYFGTPSPDMDNALKLMNIGGEPWEMADTQQQQQQTSFFPDMFPPTPSSEGTPIQSQAYTAPAAAAAANAQEMTPSTQAATISNPYLADEEKLSLISLALNLGPLPTSFLQSGALNFGMGMASLCSGSSDSPSGASPKSSVSASASTSTKNGNGAKTALNKVPASKEVEKSSDGNSNSNKAKARHVDRAAHNDIERRYRTNLKHKIAELKDAIPTLCGEDEESGAEGGQGSSSKISKGTVLTKATEYIHHLEEKNKAMEAQQQVLLRRLQAVEILLDPRRSLAARMGVKSEASTPQRN